MNDLISRKWLMECVEEGWIKFDTEKDTNKFIHLIRDTAPSVQPELFGNSEQLDGEYDPRPDIYYLAEKIGIHRLYALVVQLRGEPESRIETIGRRVQNLSSVQPEQVLPHRNYKNLSAYWCECGCYLGKKEEKNYCPDCGRRIDWNERIDQ